MEERAERQAAFLRETASKVSRKEPPILNPQSYEALQVAHRVFRLKRIYACRAEHIAMEVRGSPDAGRIAKYGRAIVIETKRAKGLLTPAEEREIFRTDAQTTINKREMAVWRDWTALLMPGAKANFLQRSADAYAQAVTNPPLRAALAELAASPRSIVGSWVLDARRLDRPGVCPLSGLPLSEGARLVGLFSRGSIDPRAKLSLAGGPPPGASRAWILHPTAASVLIHYHFALHMLPAIEADFKAFVAELGEDASRWSPTRVQERLGTLQASPRAEAFARSWLAAFDFFRAALGGLGIEPPADLDRAFPRLPLDGGTPCFDPVASPTKKKKKPQQPPKKKQKK